MIIFCDWIISGGMNGKTAPCDGVDSSQFFGTHLLATIDTMTPHALGSFIKMSFATRSVRRQTAPSVANGMLAARIIPALLLTSCLAISPPVLAQESREEIKSARCSAIFTMLAEAFTEDARVPVFRRFIRVFNELYLQEKKERTGSASAQDGESRRAFLLKEFRETYAARQGALKEEVVLCGAWADGYLAQGDNVTHVPVIPKLIPATVRQEYEALAEAGWARWLK